MKASTGRITAVGYFFIHLAVELLCFTVLFGVYKFGEYWWLSACLFDTLAFGLQAPFGAFFEKHHTRRPGVTGGLLLLAGAVLAFCFRENTLVLFIALFPITAGNAMVHLSGAFATLRVSRGRLSESAVFVAGGSFGLVIGKLLATHPVMWGISLSAMALATLLSFFIDKRIKEEVEGSAFDFSKSPCEHQLATKPACITVLVLFSVVFIRAYIGYGLPTAWNQTVPQTILLYVFMGLGKMAGGILSDRFGARKVGVISCLAAVPMLLLSNNIMWLSLLGVACFSMTMAISLGGLVSVMPAHPGVAFGITTLGLLLGSAPTFLYAMPSRQVCDILIFVFSVLAAAGIWYCIDSYTEKED